MVNTPAIWFIAVSIPFPLAQHSHKTVIAMAFRHLSFTKFYALILI